MPFRIVIPLAIFAILGVVGAWRGGWFGGDDWAACILSNMPQAENDIAAALTAKACAAEYPGMTAMNRHGAAMARYNSADECFMSVGRTTRSGLGARMLLGACNMTYGTPVIDPKDVIPDPQ
ncbi:hypothetical protein [Burkholderia anthina]|uniref:hypothetical protein n=1 Tax=Burkholderia anthina TaxID=179879 RepID=UPI0037BED985